MACEGGVGVTWRLPESMAMGQPPAGRLVGTPLHELLPAPRLQRGGGGGTSAAPPAFTAQQKLHDGLMYEVHPFARRRHVSAGAALRASPLVHDDAPEAVPEGNSWKKVGVAPLVWPKDPAITQAEENRLPLQRQTIRTALAAQISQNEAEFRRETAEARRHHECVMADVSKWKDEEAAKMRTGISRKLEQRRWLDEQKEEQRRKRHAEAEDNRNEEVGRLLIAEPTTVAMRRAKETARRSEAERRSVDLLEARRRRQAEDRESLREDKEVCTMWAGQLKKQQQMRHDQRQARLQGLANTVADKSIERVPVRKPPTADDGRCAATITLKPCERIDPVWIAKMQKLTDAENDDILRGRMVERDAQRAEKMLERVHADAAAEVSATEEERERSAKVAMNVSHGVALKQQIDDRAARRQHARARNRSVMSMSTMG
eukprot:NODE_6912_length_1626_cov_4.347565.p1 GENE.NODE_6912_length_1626_cov_4.347565~~NODE_6912_length_1626_cov_4.347565.p1  ORF type:complete len:448 (+),score=136.54 NODE_6912_length_1626_cov_4.347565:50-1345(+)